MKTLFGPAGFTSLSLTLVLLLTGCTSPLIGGAYTLKMSQTNVSWKMEAYQEGVIHGIVTVAEKQQVAEAQQAYQAAFKQALSEANGNLDAPAPANVRQLADQLIGSVDSALAF